LLLFLSSCTNTSPKNEEKEITEEEKPFIPVSINKYISNADCDYSSTESFDNSIEKFINKWEIKGASFALMKDGRLIYAKGYGFTDEENNIPMESSTLLRVASVSKLFTAVAIMKLIEDGQLSLNSKVFGESGILNDSAFLTLRDKRMKQIKVIDLLTHRSCISTPLGDPCFNLHLVTEKLNKELPLTLDDMVEYATKYRLRGSPGTQYKYSNLGYVILTKIIEKVTGMEYETYMQDSIFTPIYCFDFHLSENFIENRMKNETSYYEVQEAEKYPAVDGSTRWEYKSNGGNDIKLLSGAGGWAASPAEILRFIAAIDSSITDPNILSNPSIELMTENRNPIGWSCTKNAWLRSGSMAGTNALVKRQNNGYTWIFVTNTSSWQGYKFNSIINRDITRYIARVKEWPETDLFEHVVKNNRKTERTKKYISQNKEMNQVRKNVYTSLPYSEHDTIPCFLAPD
jgi:CubicO group peptidase (beta-lactamase class C family)